MDNNIITQKLSSGLFSDIKRILIKDIKRLTKIFFYSQNTLNMYLFLKDSIIYDGLKFS
jgi:prephenate dehydrogenase